VIHLNDLFHTVQGEGFHVGRRALFVRMPYCNLACSWCDTQFNSHQEWSPADLVEFAQREPTRFAVITGGEPTMHKHTPRVIECLEALGFRIAIETNGHFPIPRRVSWVCCSPKRDQYKGSPPYHIDPMAYRYVDEFKYVVDDGFDFSVLDRHQSDNADRSRFWVHHWLSPEHTHWARNVVRILEYVTKNPMWRLNLQTHKLIGVP
jgi:7-carboxy-7-deazaguanine synthase